MRHPTTAMRQKEERTEVERLRRDNVTLERELASALETIGRLRAELESIDVHKVRFPEQYYSNKEVQQIPSVAKTDWEYVDKIIREMRHYQTMLDQANDIIHRYQARFALLNNRYPQMVGFDQKEGV